MRLTFFRHTFLTKLGQYFPAGIEKYTPSALIDNAGKVMIGQDGPIMAPMLVLMALIAVLLILAIKLFKRQEL